MKILLAALLTSIALTAHSAIWRDQRTGTWIGDICQTPLGWQKVPPQPVGSVCWSQGWQSYGFIANY